MVTFSDDQYKHRTDPAAAPTNPDDEIYPAPRFLKCGYNDVPLIGYGYLTAERGGPDVITFPDVPESLRGDVNGDGAVDVADISTVIDVMVGKL